MKPIFRFCLLGLLVAFLEEFITQGVLKRSLLSWIIPAFIAFVPFLIIAKLIGGHLDKKMKSGLAATAYYLVSGGIGLMIEWFLIGLSPWSSSGSNPLLMLVFQAGIFSFWGSVAFAPRLLLDKRKAVVVLRKWYKRFLTVGFVTTYILTLTASRQTQLIVGITSVILVFVSLNMFYFRYVRILNSVPSGSM